MFVVEVEISTIPNAGLRPRPPCMPTLLYPCDPLHTLPILSDIYIDR